MSARARHKTRYPGIYYRLVDEGKPDGARRYIVYYSDANGKGHTQTLPLEASLEDARLLQGQLQSRKASGETLVRTRKTVGELLDEWMDSQRGRVKPKTVEDYEGAIRRLKKAFGTRKVTELSPSDVARLIDQMKGQGLKTWTVRKTMTPLRMAYTVAVREGWVSSSPVDKLLPSEKPKGDASEKRCLSKDEISRLLVSTRDRQGGENHRWKALFALLCFTGLRISEALSLTWDDVTEDRVIVRAGKTDAAKREVILIPAVARMLSEINQKRSALKLVHVEGEMQLGGVRAGDPPSKARVPKEVLRHSPTDAPLPGTLKGWGRRGAGDRSPWVRDGETRREVGIGASVGDVTGTGAPLGQGGIGSPQERRSERQPSRELGVVGGGDSFRAEGDRSDVPALRGAVRASRYVFSTRTGRQVSRREALRALRATCKRAGIPSYTLHELRHTFASILIAQGELPTLVAKQMGHADPAVTMKTYAHLFEAVESTDRARERLQEAMGGMV